MKERSTLTKSLHTVTVVSRIANQLMADGKADFATDACKVALRMLGVEDNWTEADTTFAACVEKVKRLRAVTY